MASTMFATEITSSAFLGTAMACTSAISGPARVTMMGFSTEDLQRKPLSLIRQLARQRGLPMSTKHQMIVALVGSSPSSSSSSSSYSSSSSFSAPRQRPSSASDGEYASKTLGELRALAKSRSLRGDTRAEIIALQGSPAPKTGSSDDSSSYSSSSSAPAQPSSAPRGLPKAQLERKSLAELRAMARIRGLRGDTKAELVKLLADNSTASGQAQAPAPSHSAPSYSNTGSSSFGNNNGSGSGNGNSSAGPTHAARLLNTKSLSQLRAMAAIRGIRGSTKQDLVRQLAMFS